MSNQRDAIVVGGGLAGLSCARELQSAGLSVRLLEAADRVGGRVRTDQVEGFLLDRGFQVFLEAYPEARRQLDYNALDLHSFYPGALIRVDGRFKRVTDPWRKPLRALSDLFDPVFPLMDYLKVAKLRREALRGDLRRLWSKAESSTLRRLKEKGAGQPLIERFFRPFFGGVFLEPDLATSSRMFEFVFRMMASGATSLPARGMESIPRQLAEGLESGTALCQARVEEITRDGVRLASGETLQAKAIVLAVEGPEAARLVPEIQSGPWRSVSCHYFAADKAPIEEPILVLSGSGAGPVNNLAVLTNVCPSYGPPGGVLISASCLHVTPESEVKAELSRWFGAQTARWKPLATYHIRKALPDQRPPLSPGRTGRVRPGLFVCGDYLESGSINGAMVSGRRAAESVLGDL